jgi:hypothetical protein
MILNEKTTELLSLGAIRSDGESRLESLSILISRKKASIFRPLKNVGASLGSLFRVLDVIGTCKLSQTSGESSYRYIVHVKYAMTNT